MNEVFKDIDKLFKGWIEEIKEKIPYADYEWKVKIEPYQYKFVVTRYSVTIQALDTSKPGSGWRYISSNEDICRAPKYFMKNLKQLMVETEKNFASYEAPQHSIKARDLASRIGSLGRYEIWEFETDAGVIAFEDAHDPIFKTYSNRGSLERIDSYELGKIDTLRQDSFFVKHLDAMLEYAKQPRNQAIPPHLVDRSIKNIFSHFIQGKKECAGTEISGTPVQFYGNGLTIGRGAFNIGAPYSMGRTARGDRFLIENEEQIITYIKECRARKKRSQAKSPDIAREARALVKTFDKALTSTLKRIDDVQVVHDSVKYVFTCGSDRYNTPFKLVEGSSRIAIHWPHEGEWDSERVRTFIDKWPAISQLFKKEIERIVGEAKTEEDDLANNLKSDFMTELMLMRMGGAE